MQDGAWSSAAQMLTRPGASLAHIAAAAAAEGITGAGQLARLAGLGSGISVGQASWGGGAGGADAAVQQAGAGAEVVQAGSEPADGCGTEWDTSVELAAEGSAGSAADSSATGTAWLPSASALATATYNCHYRPYMRKQVRGVRLVLLPTFQYAVASATAACSSRSLGVLPCIQGKPVIREACSPVCLYCWIVKHSPAWKKK